MVEAADSRQSNDSGLWRWVVLGGSDHRGILQLSVDSVGVVVIDVFAEKASKVVFVQGDHVIQ